MFRIILIVAFWLTLSPQVVASELSDTPTREELEAWFNDDSDLKVEDVNEGELHILEKQGKSVFHSVNRITITPDSIDTGWVKVAHCYRNLDAVAEVQVVYQYKFMRNLKIDSVDGINKAWVEGQSVQLQGVSEKAILCTQAEARAFYQNEDGSFTLANGPYQRRFLDGYYPMRVSIDIQYPEKLLRFNNAMPANISQRVKTDKSGTLVLDIYFEGKLSMKFNFNGKH